MGSNVDFLNDLESFLDNPASAHSLMSNASPNPVPSPVASATTTTATSGVRELLRNHLNGGGEKRKLDDSGGHSDLMAKTQRTDDGHHPLLLEGYDQDELKPEDLEPNVGVLNGTGPQHNAGPPVYNNGAPHQGGLLAQALMEKRPNHNTNNSSYMCGVSSPMSGLGSPSPVAMGGMGASPQPAVGVASPSTRQVDMAAIKQQLHAISNDPTLKNDQKTARLNELINQYPQIRRILMNSNKMQKEKQMRRTLPQETATMLSPRDQMSPLMPMQQQQQQSEFSGGFPMNDSSDVFPNNPYFENSMSGAPVGGVVNGYGGPVTTAPPAPNPRIRGSRGGMPQPLPGMSNNPGFHNPELWDMNYGGSMNNRLPGNGNQHPQPPPQYPYRQMVSKQPNMMGPNGYNQGPGDYMVGPPGMYNPQQQHGGYMGQRVSMPNENLYNSDVGPGMRGFNPPGYPGGANLRMNNPYPDNFQGDYMIPPHQQQPQGRNMRHPDFMYQQQHPRMGNNMIMNQGMPPSRSMNPGGFGMMSPRMQGNIGQMSPSMAPGPMHNNSMSLGGGGGQLNPAAVNPINSNMHNMYNNVNSMNGPSNNGFNSPMVGGNNTNNNNSSNSNMTNGFPFNEEYLGPPGNSMHNSHGPDDSGMEALLGLDELNSHNTNIPAWKHNAVDVRRDMLQRMLTALKDSQPSGVSFENEVSAIEEETFHASETKDIYFQRLAEWLAAKFGQLSQQTSSASNGLPNNAFPDSTTTVQDSNVSCPKLSSSSDLLMGSAGGGDNFGPSDQLAKANPILAETLAAASTADMNESGSNPATDTKESNNHDSFSNSSNTSSPVSATTAATTASTSDLGSTTAAATTEATSPSSTATTTTSSRQPLAGDNNNFHRPNLDQGSMDKIIQRAPTARRSSGKSNNNNNNNNPHSVDSGIGSPRSTASSSLYSPKLLGSSPSLVAVSHSETSPGKMS